MSKKNIVIVRDSFSIADSIAELAPKIKDHLPNMIHDSATSSNKVTLLSEIASTFADIVNGNNAYYPEKHIKDSVSTWTTPHQKPILVNHDPKSKPLGRNVGAIYKPTAAMVARAADAKLGLNGQGSGYISNLVNISDAEAVEMVMDGRYQTVSVGGDSDNMICSVCHRDWATEGKCGHKFGDDYEMKDGSIKTAYWIAGPLRWAELSFVNIPATDYAMIVTKDIHGGDSQDLLKIYNYSEVNKNTSPVVDSLRKRYFTAYAINDSSDGVELNERTTVDDLYRVYGKRSVAVDIQLDSKESKLADSNVPAKPEQDAPAPAVPPVVNAEVVAEKPVPPAPAFVAPAATPAASAPAPAAATEAPAVPVTPEAEKPAPASEPPAVPAPKDSSEELKIKDAEIVDLKAKLTALETQLKSVQDEKSNLVTQLTDFQVKIKQEKANRLLDLKRDLSLETIADDKERETKIKDLMERSIESIEDALKDLGQAVTKKIKDVSASGKKPYIKDMEDPATVEDAEEVIDHRVDKMSIEDIAYTMFKGGINPRVR